MEYMERFVRDISEGNFVLVQALPPPILSLLLCSSERSDNSPSFVSYILRNIVCMTGRQAQMMTVMGSATVKT